MIATLLVSVETTLLLSVAAIYIVHCPFNKVEESFNTQAVHDILNIFPNNLPSTQHTNSTVAATQDIAVRSHLPWDHTQYPGVVPRTFVGALMVGLPLRLAKYFILNGYMTDGFEVKDEHDLTAQFILQLGSRFALCSFLVISLGVLTRAIQRRYGLAYRLCFLVITVSQFHYMFYASRFLPNTFAAILANLVFASWIGRQYGKSIIYIALCVVIFRFDTIILFGWLLVDGVFIRRFLSLKRVLTIGIPAGLVAIMLTFIVDSIFWARPVWPELEGLYFNVWLNKSHEWGTQPYFWYVYSCIPRMMMASAPLLVLAEHKFTRDYLIPVLAFIFTYSLLPHKELRFILYTVPLLNLCATSGLMNLHYYLNKTFVYLSQKTLNKQQPQQSKRLPGAVPQTKAQKPPQLANQRKGQQHPPEQRNRIAMALFAIVILGMILANVFGCFVLSSISSHNYPGGQAALSLGVTKELLEMAKSSLDAPVGLRDLRSHVAVYVDNLAAQTGVTRFVQVDGVYYAKTPKITQATFPRPYKLIYLVLEPHEVEAFLRAHCPLGANRATILERGSDAWRRTSDELKCTPPNQPEMFCYMIDTLDTFASVNIGGLLRRVRQVNSLASFSAALQEANFIKTRVALHILRCSTSSKFNPFPT